MRPETYLRKHRLFCWQCGNPLKKNLSGESLYVLVRVGEQDVKVHKICRQGAIAYQRFDSTPVIA